MDYKDGKHSKSNVRLPNNILYRTRRRTSVYNDFIPLNEQNKKKEPGAVSRLARGIGGLIKEKTSKVFDFFRAADGKKAHGKKREYSLRTQRYEQAAEIKAQRSFFRTRFFAVSTIACACIIGASFICIPLAFAKETHTVTMYDGGREFTAETVAETVGEFLDMNGIAVGSDDYLETPEETEITDGMSIIIRRAMDLTVKNGTESTSVTMVAGTVADALSLAGITIEEGDEIYPSVDSYVRSGMTIDYINVDVEYVTETKTLGFQEITVETDELYEGEQKITQYGSEGTKEVTYKQVYKNGMLYSSDVHEEVVTVEPVNEILAVGTKVYAEPDPEPERSSSGGSNKGSSSSSSGSSSSGGSKKPSTVSTEGAPAEIQGQIKYAVKSEVTAYCSNCDGSGVGSSGAALSAGSLSADTGMFPYGTKIYVPGYGIGYVVDTGGAIGGTDIDIYMGTQADETACNNWGRRNVTVYVLN